MIADRGKSVEQAKVAARVPLTECGLWQPEWRICRYDEEQYERECKMLAERAGLHLLAAKQWADRARACRQRGDQDGELVAIREEMRHRSEAERLMDKVMGPAYSISEFKGNLLLNEGINTMWTLICGGTATAYSNANTYLGVGDDNLTAAAATQTGLLGTNNAYAPMVTGYPTFGTNQQAVFRAEFDGLTANFAWEEFTVVNAADDTGDNLNRLLSAQGTKTSGQIWTLELQVTLS